MDMFHQDEDDDSQFSSTVTEESPAIAERLTYDELVKDLIYELKNVIKDLQLIIKVWTIF